MISTLFDFFFFSEDCRSEHNTTTNTLARVCVEFSRNYCCQVDSVNAAQIGMNDMKWFSTLIRTHTRSVSFATIYVSAQAAAAEAATHAISVRAHTLYT